MTDRRETRFDEDAVGIEMADLGQALESIRPPFDESRAVALATSSLEVGSSPSQARRTWAALAGFARRSVANITIRNVSRWAAPAGAIAGVAGIAWVTTRPPEMPALVHVASVEPPPAPPFVTVALPPSEVAFEEPEPVFSVDAPEDQGVAVFQTSNPKIRVVWFYDEAESED